MAWRVIEDDVVDVIMVEDPDGVVSDRTKRTLASALDAANALTDKVSALDSGDGGASVLNDALLIEIEKYLAAWFAEAFASNQQASKESSLGASTDFQGQTGMGLEDNKFGQRALILDVSGNLRELNEGVHTVGVEWLGLAPSEQTPYSSRD